MNLRTHFDTPRWAIAFICLVPVLMTGCLDPDSGLDSRPADGEELPILRQVNRSHSHETRSMQLVIRDAAALARVPLEDVPVNFDKEMLLVITLGRVPSDQYSVQIDRVYRDRGVLKVDATVNRPPSGAPLEPASPYCIAVVPKCDLNVERFSADPPVRTRTWSQSEPGMEPK